MVHTQITKMSYKDSANTDEDDELLNELHQEVQALISSGHPTTRNLKKTDIDKQVPTPTSVPHYEDIVLTEIERTWGLFSVKHHISPSRHLSVNNNVQSQLLEKKKKVQIAENVLQSGKQQRISQETCSQDNQKQSAFPDAEDLILKAIVWPLKVFILLLKVFACTLLVVTIFYCLLTLHKPTQSLISRNTQDLIYPFMRALRLMSLPIVKRFPVLTDYYEEYCLVSNPFYEVEEVECWSCMNVRHVIDLTGFSNFSSTYQDSGVPFIVKDAVASEIGLDDIRNIFVDNQELLKDTLVETRHGGMQTLKNVLSTQNSAALKSKDFHMKWYINRVTIARLWRYHFPKPYFVPLTREISVEHFLFVDSPESQRHKLPLTEFANVFLTQASGNRSIVLIPTEQCQNQCKVVSVVLQPKDVLFYNWMFWSPMSISGDSSSFQTSVSFMGSFY